jgi:pyridoxine 5'-phosphate synthase PdxJ
VPAAGQPRRRGRDRFNTGQDAEARTRAAMQSELEKLRVAASLAAEQGLAVFAGHGLNYHNILPVRAIPELEEVNIGHSIVRGPSRRLERAVRDICSRAVTLMMGGDFIGPRRKGRGMR